MIISSEQGAAKPALEIFRKAEAAAPHLCNEFLLVGDDVECDQVGAKSAGWNFYKIDRPVQCMEQLLNFLESNYEE